MNGALHARPAGRDGPHTPLGPRDVVITSVLGERPQRAMTIGDELERVRLQRRARQLEGVLACLRLRSQAVDAGHVERAGLQRALADFHAELTAVRAQLDQPPSRLVAVLDAAPARPD